MSEKMANISMQISGSDMRALTILQDFFNSRGNEGHIFRPDYVAAELEENDATALQNSIGHDDDLYDFIDYYSNDYETYSSWASVSDDMFLLTVYGNFQAEHIIPFIAFFKRNKLEYIIKVGHTSLRS